MTNGVFVATKIDDWQLIRDCPAPVLIVPERPWRKRGLGEALLLQSFGEFYKRGTRTIGLGVDAQNPTGATRLYQKVGMYIASEYVTYEKELRPGREIEQ